MHVLKIMLGEGGGSPTKMLRFKVVGNFGILFLSATMRHFGHVMMGNAGNVNRQVFGFFKIRVARLERFLGFYVTLFGSHDGGGFGNFKKQIRKL
jgi:hypothetical protein